MSRNKMQYLTKFFGFTQRSQSHIFASTLELISGKRVPKKTCRDSEWRAKLLHLLLLTLLVNKFIYRRKVLYSLCNIDKEKASAGTNMVFNAFTDGLTSSLQSVWGSAHQNRKDVQHKANNLTVIDEVSYSQPRAEHTKIYSEYINNHIFRLLLSQNRKYYLLIKE